MQSHPKYTLFAVATLTVAVAACAGSPAHDNTGSASRNDASALPATIGLTVGGSMDVPDANLRIRFDSVTSDSRCPTDVQCIQAGSATVALTIAKLTGQMTKSFASLSTAPGKDTATVYSQPLRLLSVEPGRVSTAPTPMSAYRIELGVGARK